MPHPSPISHALPAKASGTPEEEALASKKDKAMKGKARLRTSRIVLVLACARPRCKWQGFTRAFVRTCAITHVVACRDLAWHRPQHISVTTRGPCEVPAPEPENEDACEEGEEEEEGEGEEEEQVEEDEEVEAEVEAKPEVQVQNKGGRRKRGADDDDSEGAKRVLKKPAGVPKAQVPPGAPKAKAKVAAGAAKWWKDGAKSCVAC